jgi:pantothenate kinase
MPQESPLGHVSQLYVDISKALASTAEQVAAPRVDHQEGRQTLIEIRAQFDGELDLLQQQAEWDRFTIAFFGETNAGKSTVLEALRILFSEEGRQALLDANDRDLVRYEQALIAQVESVRAALQDAAQAHAARLSALTKDVEQLTTIVQEESSARVRMRHWLFAVAGTALGAAVTFVALKLVAAA